MAGLIKTVIFPQAQAFFNSRSYKPTREENKHLVSRVVIVRNQNSEICPSGATLTGLVAKLTLEFVEGLVQLVLGHQIASVMT